MFLLCLVSSDSPTRSLALRRNVVSDVVRRLGTFAILVLSTLAAMFLFFEASSGLSERSDEVTFFSSMGSSAFFCGFLIPSEIS